MSGVIAVFNRNHAPVAGRCLEDIHQASMHRAVHGHRVWVDGPIGLVHQHFSLDHKEEIHLQPLDGAGGLFGLTCDARLDDRELLKGKVGLADHRDVSDAELVLKAYEKWGRGCVDHLLGDFAFLLWDSRKQLLFGARDALGVRDLSYFISESLFVAASETAQVLAHPEVPRRLNEGRLAEFLVSHWQNHDETVFEGIFYCPPGHSFEVSADSFGIWRYWDLDEVGRRPKRRSDEDYVEEFLDLLTKAVRSRLEIPGEACVSLSGGPDSVALAGIAAREVAPKPLKSFSYVFDRFPSCDERPFIRPVVEELGLESVFIQGDGLWPFQDPTTWPVFPDFPGQDPYVRLSTAVADAARDAGCRTILNGHYSDILLAGGDYWAAEMPWSQLLMTLAAGGRGLSWRRDVLRRGLWMRAPRWMRKAVRGVRSQRPPSYDGFLEPDFVRHSALEERLSSARQENRGGRPVAAAGKSHLLFAILAQGAAAARKPYNSRGLELVDPFWDRSLVEFAFDAPADVLGRPPWTKWVLRQALQGMVSDAVLTRRDKTSLNELFRDGLLNRENRRVEQVLADPKIVRMGYVSEPWLRRELLAGAEWSNHGYRLWLCLSLELWLQRYAVVDSSPNEMARL